MSKDAVLAAIPAGALVLGLAFMGAGQDETTRLAFAAGILIVLAALLLSIATALARGEVGLDVIAALAMAGALVAGEELAGIVVALMYAGGQALEAFARERAAREMTALLARVPRSARLHRDADLVEIAIDRVKPGDRLLVAAGEVVPVDGEVASDAAVLDESALTGESLPVTRRRGDVVASGAANAGAPFDLIARRTAAEGTFAAIVRLVETARASKAPMSRLADRYALGFLALTLALAAAAWIGSGDPRRALAVLVVATPCPLILAVPVAIVAGMSRAAARGVLVKSAAAFEALARARALLLDKTGTLTIGTAGIAKIHVAGGTSESEALRLAASLALASRHAVSQALVAAARERGLALTPPSAVEEAAGAGMSGLVEGRAVVIGAPDFVRARLGQAPTADADADGRMRLDLGVDGRLAARLVLADPVRPEAGATIAKLRALGLAPLVLVTGDQPRVAKDIARALGLDRVHAGLEPAEKVEAVARERERGPVLMIGDGINDAAALARADVGIALGARGSAAAAEAADIVLLVDGIDRVPEAISIARAARRIALQGIAVGIGLSTLGMIAAALGVLPPLAGAIAQEAIDVAVVLNALRALSATSNDAIRPPDARG